MDNITQGKKWHAMPIDAILNELNSSSQEGLPSDEITKRQHIYGLNELQKTKEESSIILFLRQFHNILIYILILSAVTTFYLGHIVDTLVIVGVVLLNAIIGHIQEGKAQKALRAIRRLLVLKAYVIRDNYTQMIPATELVPGDIVTLRSGDKIPADIRLIQTKNLQVQESLLTGESNPIDKNPTPVKEHTILAERQSMAYGGTLVTYGRAKGVVVRTGTNTEVGRISSLIETVPEIITPLIKQISQFGRWLTFGIIVMSIITFAVGYLFWHNPAEEIFMIVVGLAVAAIPEGLPAIMTITLAIGVVQMAKRHAIIRRLPAVETMGSVTVICSDKTGTLTKNELSVQNIVTSNQAYYVSGVGYNNKGNILIHNENVNLDEHPDLNATILAGVLCNETELNKKNDEWHLHGNPTDGALLALGLKANKDRYTQHLHYPIIDIFPFDSQHKLMATLHKDGIIYVKGAPEYIFKRCQFQQKNKKDLPIDLDYWQQQVNNLATRGQRIVAIANLRVDSNKKILNLTDIDQGLTLLGICGIIDPPREEAIESVKECKNAHIKVKMITGDHAITASSIGQTIGIGDGKSVVTAQELDEMSDLELAKCVKDADIFARTAPKHKLRLVKALQANGDVVAMTGDGINDAPALKQADIGVAMGLKGTEATKEVAEMVLTDDNFSSIRHAIKEGRGVYDNLKKAILFILPTNAGESFIIMFAIFFGFTMPITAVQILWINMVTTVTLALAVGFETPEVDVMKRPPRKQNTPIFTGFLIWRTFFVGVIVTICGFSLFMYENSVSDNLAFTRTTMVNFIVAAEAIYLINCRKLTQATCNLKGIFGNRITIIAIASVILFQLLFTYLPIMQNFFGSKAIGIHEWIKIIFLALILFFIVEFEKMIFRKMQKY